MEDKVLKTTEFVLNTIKNTSQCEEDILYTQLSLFISNNLGIKINVNQEKYKVMSDITFEYNNRKKRITDAGLLPFVENCHRLDRNNNDNICFIQKYIKDNYNIDVDYFLLQSSNDIHTIVDYLIEMLL